MYQLWRAGSIESHDQYLISKLSQQLNPFPPGVNRTANNRYGKRKMPKACCTPILDVCYEKMLALVVFILPSCIYVFVRS